jgi:hypothetical protein
MSARIVKSIDDLKPGQQVAWSPEHYEPIFTADRKNVTGVIEAHDEGTLKIRYDRAFGGGFDWVLNFIDDGVWVILREAPMAFLPGIQRLTVELDEAVQDAADCGDCPDPEDHVDAIRAAAKLILDALEGVAA